jgi:hypothetical protein
MAMVEADLFCGAQLVSAASNMANNALLIRIEE